MKQFTKKHLLICCTATSLMLCSPAAHAHKVSCHDTTQKSTRTRTFCTDTLHPDDNLRNTSKEIWESIPDDATDIKVALYKLLREVTIVTHKALVLGEGSLDSFCSHLTTVLDELALHKSNLIAQQQEVDDQELHQDYQYAIENLEWAHTKLTYMRDTFLHYCEKHGKHSTQMQAVKDLSRKLWEAVGDKFTPQALKTSYADLNELQQYISFKAILDKLLTATQQG